MKKVVTITSIAIAPALLLVRPIQRPEQYKSGAAIPVGAQIDSHTLSSLQVSCENCHSSQTKWPLYSRIFPVSRLVMHDVQSARAHMDLSGWQFYSNSEKGRLLSEIGSVVRNRLMPPGRYLLLHPEAKLTDSDANSIYQWTRAERKRIKTAEAD